MAQDDAGSHPHDDGELADFGEILFASMAALGLVALLWAFAASLAPAAPAQSMNRHHPAMPAAVRAMLKKLH